MPFKEQLKEKLKEKIKEDELELLPSGFQRIGDIIILNLKKGLIIYKSEIGKAVSNIFPNIKTICNRTGEITGEFREPQIEVIYGDKNTETIVIENGCKYKFDAGKIMFAKGNLNERVRIASLVKKGEIVVDIFSGIGYFTLNIGRSGKAKKVYSIEKNPVSFKYLQENLKLNHTPNVEAINGDCREEVDKLVSLGVKADRVVMGYLPPPFEFLPWVFKIVKKKGVIHYEALVDVRKKDEEAEKIMKEIDEKAGKAGKKVKLISVNRVKDYAPHVEHVVLDVKVG